MESGSSGSTSTGFGTTTAACSLAGAPTTAGGTYVQVGFGIVSGAVPIRLPDWSSQKNRMAAGCTEAEKPKCSQPAVPTQA